MTTKQDILWGKVAAGLKVAAQAMRPAIRCMTCDSVAIDTLRKPLDMCRILGHDVRPAEGR